MVLSLNNSFQLRILLTVFSKNILDSPTLANPLARTALNPIMSKQAEIMKKPGLNTSSPCWDVLLSPLLEGGLTLASTTPLLQDTS